MRADGGGPLKIEDYIRDAARRGWSKSQTLEALGVTRESFYAMLEFMPPMEWPATAKGLGRRLADEARRGVCTPAIRAATAKAVAVRKALHSHEVDGVVGTIEELAAHSSVSASTVRRRIAAGMTLKEALTRPLTPPDQRRKGLKRSDPFTHNNLPSTVGEEQQA